MKGHKTPSQGPLRVVLDTNVVLSALLFNNATAQALRQAWRSGYIVPCVCTDTVQELLRVLAYPKFRLSATEQHELLGDFLPCAEVVHLGEPRPTVPAGRDAHDEVFMQLAVAAGVDALVSGDKDLLALADVLLRDHSCPVWTLQKLLASDRITAPAAATPAPPPPTAPAPKTPGRAPGRPGRRR